MRNSGFQSRHNTPSNKTEKQFFKRRREEDFNARAHEMHVPNVEDHYISVRRRQFSRLVESARTGPARIAEMTGLTEARVKSLSEGEDKIDALLAHHIEKVMGLPDDWVQNGTLPHIPDTVMVKLSAETFAAPDGLESIFGTPEAVVPNAQENEIMQAANTARHAEPTVTIKKRRTLSPVDGDPEKTATTALAQNGLPLQESDNSPGAAYVEQAPTQGASMIDIARQNFYTVLEVFPSMRQFLVAKTNLSPSSISGALAGSRALPVANIALFERCMGMPKNFLHTPRNKEEIRALLVQTLGESIISTPAPKRGRKSASSADSGPSSNAETMQVMMAAPVPATPSTVTTSTPVVAETIQAAPAKPLSSVTANPATPAVPAADLARSIGASSDKTVSMMLGVLTNALSEGVENASLGMPELASIMNHMYSIKKHA